MITSSSDVADEKQFLSTQTDKESESEVDQTLQRKEQSLQNTMEWVADKEASKSSTSVKQISKINGNATSYTMNGVKANARIRVEQNVDLVLKNLKLKILGQPYEEVLLTRDKG